MNTLRRIRHALLSTSEGRLLLAVLSTLAIGMFFYMRVEGWSFIDALYFCVVTLTTIGYGDLYPTRDVSKLFTVVYIITGLGMLASFINLIAQRRLRRTEERAQGFRTRSSRDTLSNMHKDETE